ncbi:MAG: hydantoinase B/oxoprolinase family protein [Thermoplasmata archaeon]
MDPISLEVMKNAFTFVPEEMGQALRRTSYSPNIKERMDASCAIFDALGRMITQAEHIPVHLGSMPLAIQAIQGHLRDHLEEGDQVILNDPYRGGSHLNDITLIRPVFWEEELAGYVANKAHHADVGGIAPGSMPTGSRTLFEEGVVFSPQRFLTRGRMDPLLAERVRKGMRDPHERMGDLRAQVAANNTGDRRFRAYLAKYGRPSFEEFADEILTYSERRVRRALQGAPDGTFEAEDQLDDDGVFDEPLPLHARVTVKGEDVTVDFAETAEQSSGNVNAPYAVTLSSVYYALRTLTDPGAPPNEGCYRAIRVAVPEGSLLNPRKPAAVAAGNVETSQRIVDVLLRAFEEALPAIVPAQSQGTMNNLLIGGKSGEREFAYYETIGGGEGALPFRDGMSGVQTHMTNTMNTPVEALETAYPFRVEEYRLREGSGGLGRFRGGLGIRRSIRFLGERGTASLITERRRFPPRGLRGGLDGKPGENVLIRGEDRLPLPSKTTIGLRRDDIIVVATPGGGGWGRPDGEIG